jgi:hypothetical protein
MSKKLVIVQLKHGRKEDVERLRSALEKGQAFGSLADYEFIVAAGDVQFSTLEEKIIEAAGRLAREIIKEVKKEGVGKDE